LIFDVLLFEVKPGSHRDTRKMGQVVTIYYD